MQLALTATQAFGVHMRVATLEITGALLAVAVVATRPRVRAATEVGPLVPMRVVLEIADLGTPRRYEGRPPFEIGRSAEVDLSLRDPEVSRRHARFEARNGVVYVGDLGSRNGTFLNGRRVTEPIEVRGGDAVDVGATRMHVRAVEPWS